MVKRTLALPFVSLCALLLEATGCNGSSTPAGNPPAAPTVASMVPTSGATGVAANATLTVTFSEAMDPATVNATTFTVKDSAGAAVAGAVACSGTTATFTATLTPLVTYTATITTGAKSLAGTALETDRSWSFTVATTPTPLLSRATLKAWIDVGLVNGTGSERVVVLDVTSPTAYAAGHIPGAHLLNLGDATTPLYQNRQEGPAVDVNMVPDGAHMDAVVHRYGIDDHVTIVFTGSGAGLISVTRAYWTFRYWGFAKDKLKLLDGLNAGWGTAYAGTASDLTAVVPPAITPSTYSVKSNGTLRHDLRASLPEMMDVAAGNVTNAVILDARSTSTTGSYSGSPGSTAGVFNPAGSPSDSVVFEGRVAGAKALAYTELYDPATFEFKAPAALATLFGSVGIDSTKTAYVHCRTGVIATAPFFVLDAILDWPVVNYDGSWSQWGQLSAASASGGQLAADSPWITDGALSELVVYNHATKAVEVLTADGASCTGTLAAADTTTTWFPASCSSISTLPDSHVASGNQIEDADALYMTQ